MKDDAVRIDNLFHFFVNRKLSVHNGHGHLMAEMRLAEELNRRAEQLSVQAAVQKLDCMDEKVVFQFGLGGWLETLEEAKGKARSSDWERYMNFRESSFSYAALLLITTYVRRMIPNPEMTYGKTWCICLNETGCPDLNWISVKTQAGSVFCVDVCHTPLGSDVKAVFWVERRRLDLLLERAEGKDEEMQIMLGITHGTFDLKRNYHDLSNDTSMHTCIDSRRRMVGWQMDLDQALDFFQSPLAVALLTGCAETISAKETGEGFRLGRLFF